MIPEVPEMIAPDVPVSAGAGEAMRAGEQPIALAKALIEAGKLVEARDLLEARLGQDGDDIELLFLLGLIAIGLEDYPIAIDRFAAALVAKPGATRVRLELARSLYLAGYYDRSFRQFQLARAGNVPAPVAATIDLYLAKIRQEKSWSHWVSAAIAPDSNVNAATSARETTIFGLPFLLGDDIRRRSGVGLSLAAGGEFAPQLADAVRMRVGAAVERRDYDGVASDDMTVSAWGGPRWASGRWDISLLGTGYRRWFGGKRLADGYGGRIEATRYIDGRTAATMGLSVQQIVDRRTALRSGRGYSVGLGWFRALNPAATISAQIGAFRQAAASPDLSSWTWLASAAYRRDFTGGLTAEVSPRVYLSRYGASDPFFGVRRNDAHIEVELGLSHRRLRIGRFSPRIGYTFARRRSSIDLYSFTQNKADFGLTSQF